MLSSSCKFKYCNNLYLEKGLRPCHLFALHLQLTNKAMNLWKADLYQLVRYEKNSMYIAFSSHSSIELSAKAWLLQYFQIYCILKVKVKVDKQKLSFCVNLYKRQGSVIHIVLAGFRFQHYLCPEYSKGYHVKLYTSYTDFELQLVSLASVQLHVILYSPLV